MKICRTGIGLSTEQNPKNGCHNSSTSFATDQILYIPQLFHDRNRLPNKGYQFILMVIKKPISQETLVDIDRVRNTNFGEIAASSFARHQRLSQQLRSVGRAHSAIDAMQLRGVGPW
jgi:hypothetical protein